MKRYCNHCGKLMYDGFCVGYDFTEYYCSEDCLHHHYTPEEYNEMYEDDVAYWTEWWDEADEDKEDE